MADKKEMIKQKFNYNQWGTIGFIIIVIAFGFFVFSDKDNNDNSISGKKVIDMNVTCTDMNRAAEALTLIYGVKPGEVILYECNNACTNLNLTFYDYKCTPEDKFLCYCNVK